MTRLPVEPRRLATLADGHMPAYEWRGQCRVPGCTEAATDPHHIVRRSAGGRTWILVDGQPVPNIAGVCRYHHDRLTEGAAMIRWNARWEWIPDVGIDAAERDLPLDPLAPSQGVRKGRYCPTCGRAWPQPRPAVPLAGRKRRRRGEFKVRVPADGEDGARILAELAGQVSEVIYGEPNPDTAYHAIAAALVYAIQHEDDVRRQLATGRDQP